MQVDHELLLNDFKKVCINPFLTIAQNHALYKSFNELIKLKIDGFYI